MRRLLQALSSKIYVGDIVKNTLDPNNLYFRTYIVEELRKNGWHELFVTYKQDYRGKVMITQPVTVIRKMKWLTLESEIEKRFFKKPVLEVDKVKTLQEMCEENNIGYLYKDLMDSKNIDRFHSTSCLINQMLKNKA